MCVFVRVCILNFFHYSRKFGTFKLYVVHGILYLDDGIVVQIHLYYMKDNNQQQKAVAVDLSS